jgi:hypothetical protein
MRKVTFVLAVFMCTILADKNSEAQNDAYFQQEVNYNIEVTLDDQRHFLYGDIEIEYTNNSPDDLDFIYFHLWPNAYKNNETALAKQKAESSSTPPDFTKDKNQGYIDSLQFKVNGNMVKHKLHPEHIDICKVLLNEPLKSGESITITTPFRVKIPWGSISRFGHAGKGYKITQWYPKPAVYDEKGWHEMPYLDQGEFYSEFGSFDVSITIPKDYVVAATGNLKTEAEKEWLNKLAANGSDGSDRKPPESHSSNNKTIRYTEDSIHDFAWFADKDYLVAKDTLELPNSGRSVNCWAFYRENNKQLWKKATTYIQDALHYYSKWYGDYAYDNCTAISNPPGTRGSGMEYPTITAIGKSIKDFQLETVIMHEVGHNWFYGMLGFNEREHPWMDEGINTFSEIRYMQEKYPDNNLVSMILGDFAAKALGIKSLEYKSFHHISYLFSARPNKDQPANLHSVDYEGGNYGSMVYSKAGSAMYMLMHYLGEEEFNRVMEEFCEQWRFKHPYPEDFKEAFLSNTDKELDWFFNSALSTNEEMDYKAKKVKDDKFYVKNKAEGEMPFPVTGLKDGEPVYTKWYDGFEGKKWVSLPDKQVDRLYIDYHKNTLEINRRNNFIRTKGVFKTVNPVSLHPVGPIEQPHYTQINFIPALGYNYYNKMMAGMFFHSGFVLPDNFHYRAMPFYSFGTHDIAGAGNVSYMFYPEKSIFRNINLKLSGKKYAFDTDKGDYFDRVKLQSTFNMKRAGSHDRIYSHVRLSGTYATDVTSILNTPDDLSHKLFANLEYSYRNYEHKNTFKSKVGIEMSDDFAKASVTTNYSIEPFADDDKTIDLRLFGGVFLYEDNVNAPFYFHLSGATGIQDYTYDNTYLGRFETPGQNSYNQFLSQQFVKDDGGFAAYSPFGQTNEWLVSLNTTVPVPFLSDIIPVKAYGNLGYFGRTIDVPGYDSHNTAWETGLRLQFFNEAINVYFPAFMSDYMQQYSDDITENYWQKIRFSLDLNKLRNIGFGF